MTLAARIALFSRFAAERLRLLRLTGAGGPTLAIVVPAAYVLAACLPTARAMAAGFFVSAAGQGGEPGPLLAGVAALTLALISGQASEIGRTVAGDVLRRRIDGRIRGTVRASALAPDGIEHLEDPAFHEDAVRASDEGHGAGRARSAGAAVVGQITLLFRFLSALLPALPLAALSPAHACALLVIAMVTRARIRRQWVFIVETMDRSAPARRELAYWSDLTTGPTAKEVRLFGLADWIVNRLRGLGVRGSGPGWRELNQVLGSQWVNVTLLLAGAGLALAVPAVAAAHQHIEPGELITFALCGLTVLGLATTGNEAFDIEYGQAAVKAADRLAERQGGALTVRERRTPRNRPESPPLVCFEQVSFAYARTNGFILRDFSLVLNPGETVGLVGRNGVGKTTFIKLLARLYRPTRGTITVDGVDLDELDAKEWRRNLALVFQDYVRYPLSLGENIRLSAPETAGDPAELVAALTAAGGASLLTRLPEGVRSSLWQEGRDGTDFSGGQWQRVALARALYAVAHGRGILVLDEPTAHLDIHAEDAFYDRLHAAAPGASKILISHRLSTVRRADRIVLLDGGRITEEGSHDELMAQGGDYARMFALQAARFRGPACEGRN
jgi:ATP-binding cassette subfamily B protein